MYAIRSYYGLSEAQAQGFYAIHKQRPFFSDLVKFMTEGPIVVSVLEDVTGIAGPTASRMVNDTLSP